nr:dihydrofolate reductase family protein [Phytoactinopolyspora mesophila]
MIAWDMVTLDGFFCGPRGEIDWFVFDSELEQYILDTQLSAGAVLFGRGTYEGMAAHWPSAEGKIAEFMNRVPKVVFSRSLQKSDWSNTTVLGGDIAEEVSALKRQPGGDIFVFGSAQLTSALMENSLVDEYRLGINPVILGAGVPFFKGNLERHELRLTETRPLASGVVILHYQPAPQAR